MKCEQVNELLLAYLDEQVSAEQRAEIEAHLAGCEACAAEREALAALRADLSATVGAAGAAITLPAAAEARIAAHLEAELQKTQAPGPLAALSGWFRRWGFVLAGATAAVLVLACVGVALLSGGLQSRADAGANDHRRNGQGDGCGGGQAANHR